MSLAVIDRFIPASIETDPELQEFPSLLSLLRLPCGAVGFPEPSISWYKDGDILPGEADRTLTVQEVDVEDRGRYWCSAENFDPYNPMSIHSDTSEQVVVNIRGECFFFSGIT